MEIQENKTIINKHKWMENPAFGKIPVHLTDLLNEVIIPSELNLTEAPYRELESSDYGACQFKIENKTIMFRVANITPAKIGQFVTIWNRSTPTAEIEPIDLNGGIDYIFISVFDKEKRGIFLFNKEILVKKNIVSVNKKGGKRGIRVYAPWTRPLAKQAILTQKWQTKYFFSMNAANINLELFKQIFKMED